MNTSRNINTPPATGNMIGISGTIFSTASTGVSSWRVEGADMGFPWWACANAGHDFSPVGGIRASIYNAMPLAGCQLLASFMNDFKAKNG